MAISDELHTSIRSLLVTPWDVQDGTVVPETDSVAFQGGAKRIHATMIYADLAESTALVSYNRQMSAKIFKSFLLCCTKLIIHNGGQVRSFDGDRVMGVFIGKFKNTFAARCALQIKWAFESVIKPKLEAQYEKLRDGTFSLNYCTGVDLGEVLVVRSGIRGSNDLLWIGRAANIAAKLSSIRRTDGYNSFITEAVYKEMNNSVKIDAQGILIWKEFTHDDAGKVYGSYSYNKP